MHLNSLSGAKLRAMQVLHVGRSCSMSLGDVTPWLTTRDHNNTAYCACPNMNLPSGSFFCLPASPLALFFDFTGIFTQSDTIVTYLYI